METAGKDVEDEALREALKDRGLGTPATRAEIIETLIRREYIERHGKELTPTPKGMQVITLLGTHPLTSSELTGDWEKRLNEIEQGLVDRTSFMRSIADFTQQTVEQIVNLEPGELRPERAELGPCPSCGAQTDSIIRENSKAYGCTSWKSKDEPGCGFAIWKKLARRTLSSQIARELLEQGHTIEVLTGFRSKAGKPFRPRLLLDSDGMVTFDMLARPGAGQPETDIKAHLATKESKPAVDGTVDSNGRRNAPNGVAACSSPGAPSVPLPADLDIGEHLRKAGLDVIDKRPAGRLWVVDGNPPSPSLAWLRDQGVGFTFAPSGSRATRRRPGRWLSV